MLFIREHLPETAFSPFALGTRGCLGRCSDVQRALYRGLLGSVMSPQAQFPGPLAHPELVLVPLPTQTPWWL